MQKIEKFFTKYKDILVLYLKTYFLLGIGEVAGMLVIDVILSTFFRFTAFNFYASDLWKTLMHYLTPIGSWIILIAYLKMAKKETPIINTINTKPRGNNIIFFIAGVAIGFGLNFLCAFMAMMNKDILVSFGNFEILPAVLIFLAILVQAGSEEIICRGYLYQRILQKYKKPWVAILFNSLFFALLHVMNPNVSLVSLLSIFFAGLFPSLIIYYFDSMWLCIGEHLMWNYTQNIILGLPNSGLLVPYSIYNLEAANARNSFFYNVGFGIEGSWFAVIVMAAACLIVYLLCHKNHKENLDIWKDSPEVLYVTEPFFTLDDGKKEKSEYHEEEKLLAKILKNKKLTEQQALEKMERDSVSVIKRITVCTYIVPVIFALVMAISRNENSFDFVTFIVCFLFETGFFIVIKKELIKNNVRLMKWLEIKRQSAEEISVE